MALAPFLNTDPCPCGSGKLVDGCGCKARNFVPQRVKIHTSRVFSGRCVAGCYAKSIGDCHGKMSADHPVAASIHRLIDESGLIERRRSDGSRIDIPVSSAGRKVLCERHHCALSKLDDVGLRFVQAHREARVFRHEGGKIDQHVLFNGYDIERWMLKVLCSMAHRQPVSREHESVKWTVPVEWVRILFDGAPLPKGAGLYTPGIPRGRTKSGYHVAKIVGRRRQFEQSVPGLGPAEVHGLSLSVYGTDIDLIMAPSGDSTELRFRARSYRQPHHSGSNYYIHIGWEDTPPTFDGRVFAKTDGTMKDDLLAQEELFSR